MCVVFFTAKMDVCVSFRARVPQERKAIRSDPEPECSLVLKKSLDGTTQHGFHVLWTGRDHRAQSIVPKHDADRDSRHYALLAIQQSYNPAAL
jgi:hypothetical protein